MLYCRPGCRQRALMAIGIASLGVAACTPEGRIGPTAGTGVSTRDTESVDRFGTSSVSSVHLPDSGLDALVADTVSGLESLLTDSQMYQSVETSEQSRSPVTVSRAMPSKRLDGKTRVTSQLKSDPSDKVKEVPLTEAPEGQILPVGEADLVNPNDDGLPIQSGWNEPARVSRQEHEAAPIAPTELARELRSRLFARAGESMFPLREYMAIEGMSLVDMELGLGTERPEDLTAEESRVLAAYGRHFKSLSAKLECAVSTPELIQAAEDLRLDLVPPNVLRVGAIRLCTAVASFGNYTEVTDHVFAAGRPTDLLVYTEIENFRPTLNRNGLQETRLSQKYVIVDETDGLPVFSTSPREVTDTCRSIRRDFFLVERIRVPANLSVGRYLLKAILTDMTGGSSAEATIPLEFAAK